MNEAIDVKFTENGTTALAVREERAPVGIFGTDDPEQVIEKAVKIANALKKVIVQQGFAKKLQGKGGKETAKEWVFIEGWQTLGAMMDCFPQTVWVKNDGNEYEARVEIVRRGQVVGAAQALCTRSEWKWKSSDPYALESMAITRATSKAFRLAVGFVMAIAGYETTPGEEMEGILTAEKTPGTEATPSPSAAKGATRGRTRASSGGDATPKPEQDEERQRVVRRLFALVADYAAVGGERGADLKERMHDETKRHKLVFDMYGKNRLRDLEPNELHDFIGKIERRIAEHSGAT